VSAPAFGMTLEGVPNFERTMSRAEREIRDLHEGNTQAASALAAAARSTAPVLTGTLAGSIFTETEPGVAMVGTDLLYGSVQEFGSARINVPARRWMRAALEDAQRQVLDDLHADMQRSLNKVKGI